MAKTFTPITSKPTRFDKYIYLYNNCNNKGKSLCINGKPTDRVCNVLCNCVGWACGRFNHIYNLLTGYDGIKYPKFCCNAEQFIEVAKAYGLEVGTTPRPGAIMCWQKGATLNCSDGAGHVAVVEKVISATQITTSESGYNSFAFKVNTRNKGDGNWGASSSYKFRGFIYNPAVEAGDPPAPSTPTVTTTIPNTVSRNTSSNQIYVNTTDLRVRNKPATSGNILGLAKKGYYNYYATSYANGYTWYRIGTDMWIAHNDNWSKVYPATSTLKVGDTVCITSNAVVYGRTTKFASWVYNSVLYVRAINGDKITVSTLKSGAITGSVDRKYIVKK